MPLVKSGKVVEDRYVRVADGDPVPDQGAVIVSADRFLADADELAQRSDLVGVIWPNNRNIAELEPHLPKLALVALVFPPLRTGAPTARLGCCASAIASAANCGRLGRCCAISFCFWCGQASIPSRW